MQAYLRRKRQKEDQLILDKILKEKKEAYEKERLDRVIKLSEELKRLKI